MSHGALNVLRLMTFDSFIVYLVEFESTFSPQNVTGFFCIHKLCFRRAKKI